jgi:hypothetical protein
VVPPLRVAVAALAASAACAGAPRSSPPAVPLRVTVDLARAEVAAGTPLLVGYRWAAGPGFQPPSGPHRAFVHFLSDDGAMLVNDDHWPSPPPRTWAAGQEYRYERAVFLPRRFPGRLRMVMGLYEESTGRRVALEGARPDLGVAVGQVSSVRAGAPPLSEPRFEGGFYPAEGSAGRPFVIQRWMAGVARLSFPNPGADTVLAVQAWTGPRAFSRPPRLRLSVGGRHFDAEPADDDPFTLLALVDAEDLGAGERTAVQLTASEVAPPGVLDPRALSFCVEGVHAARLADRPDLARAAAGPTR